jgi:hypothetical protein
VFGSIKDIALSCNVWVPYWVGCKLHDQVNKLLTLDVGAKEARHNVEVCPPSKLGPFYEFLSLSQI